MATLDRTEALKGNNNAAKNHVNKITVKPGGRIVGGAFAVSGGSASSAKVAPKETKSKLDKPIKTAHEKVSKAPKDKAPSKPTAKRDFKPTSFKKK